MTANFDVIFLETTEGIDEPLAMRRDGRTYYYHQDAGGSIAAITDEAGTLVQRYEYDAYGSITYALDPAFRQPYAFTGREWDEESGLYYYRARYYDPKVGRFISRDPIGFAGGDANLYGYVRNDPVNLKDPWGLRYWPPGLGGGDVINWSPNPVPAYGDRGPFSPDCCMVIPARGPILPGESPPLADVDFIKIGGDWYKVRGPIIIQPDGTIIGDKEKVSEEEAKRLEGKKCK